MTGHFSKGERVCLSEVCRWLYMDAPDVNAVDARGDVARRGLVSDLARRSRGSLRQAYWLWHVSYYYN